MYKVLFKWLLPLLMASCFFSCQQLADEEGEGTDDASVLKVTTRSGGSAQIMYPVFLYAFSGAGECAGFQEIKSEDTPVELLLQAGTYRIVAVSGVSKGYVLPQNPSLEDVITMEDGNSAQTPMMIGKADVEVDKSGKDASVNVSLTYAVASLFVDLKNIPSYVSKVKVALSPLHSSLSMDGKYGGQSGKVEVECALDTENRWSASGVYIFPGSGEETVCSIFLETESGTETYGYTYKGTPLANHPFNLVGDYKGEVVVGGDLVAKDWDTPIDVDFVFGDKDGDDGEDPDGPGGDEGDMSGVPQVGSIWNDCIVAGVSNADENGADLLLMSLEEWESDVWNAEATIEGYSVNGIKGWRFPTEAEAKLARDRFNGDRLDELNEKIGARNLDEIEITDNPDFRYLCDKAGAFYSFQFIAGKRVTKAGDQKIYLIRAVTTYRFTK